MSGAGRIAGSKTEKYLVDAIRQLQLFEDGSTKPALIVKTIFDTIKRGAIRDKYVTCDGFGRFHKVRLTAHFRNNLRTIQPPMKLEERFIPERVNVRFVACPGLRADMRKELQ